VAVGRQGSYTAYVITYRLAAGWNPTELMMLWDEATVTTNHLAGFGLAFGGRWLNLGRRFLLKLGK
jgi:hypothetical protein